MHKWVQIQMSILNRKNNAPFSNAFNMVLNLNFCILKVTDAVAFKVKKISNDQELIQSDPTSCPQNQQGNN